MEDVDVVYINPPPDHLDNHKTLANISQSITIRNLKLLAWEAFQISSAYQNQTSRLWLLHYGAKQRVWDDDLKLYDVFYQKTVGTGLTVGLEVQQSLNESWSTNKDEEMKDVTTNSTTYPIVNEYSSTNRYSV